MREFIIEITDRVQDSELEALTQPSIIHKAGIAGEHKASRLVFCLPESWDSEWTYVVECVNSMGEGTPSEKLSVVEKDGKRTVNFDIPRSMTEMGSGDYVLEAILYDGEEVAKIIRSATVRVGIEKSPTFKKRVVDAIRGIYEELIAKLETIVNRFNNGEFNGATFIPSVSAGGDLSWSNDKNLANPETVNIKGEKGDKGDKGDDGKDGEDGKDGKDGGGKDIPIVFALSEDAQDGDMCLLASIDGIPGKTIKIDWDNLMLAAKANEGDGFGISFYMGEEPVGDFSAFYVEDENRTSFQFYNENLSYLIELVNGEIDTDISTVTELPEYFTLPVFDRIEGIKYGVELNLFTVPLSLMIYNGEWNDSGLTSEQLEALNANAAARHTHGNYWSLSDLHCEASEVEQGGNNPFPILPDYVGVDRPTFRGNYLRYDSDGAVINKIEPTEEDGAKFLRMWFNKGVLDTLFDVPLYINIPVKDIIEKPEIGLNGTGLELELPTGGVSGDFITYDEFNQAFSMVDNGLMELGSLANIALKQRTKPDFTTLSIDPAYYFEFGEVENITITDFFVPEDLSVYENEYRFSFISGETPTVLNMPDDVVWANGDVPTIQPNARYIVTVLDNIASYITTAETTPSSGDFVTTDEMQEYVTAAINGSLDEIETMIDESGVLDE